MSRLSMHSERPFFIVNWWSRYTIISVTELCNEIQHMILAKRFERVNIKTYSQETKSNQMPEIRDN